MNKALIKKYWTEFQAWVDGKSLLLGYQTAEGYEWANLKDDDWEYCISKNVVILNDEYVEFRKALAEGKTIEKNINYAKSFPVWEPTNSLDMLYYTPEVLRISPNEPKFKVGATVTLECVDVEKGFYKLK